LEVPEQFSQDPNFDGCLTFTFPDLRRGIL